MGKQRQLLLQPTEVVLGLQVGVEFDNIVQWNDSSRDKSVADSQSFNIMFTFLRPWYSVISVEIPISYITVT